MRSTSFLDYFTSPGLVDETAALVSFVVAVFLVVVVVVKRLNATGAENAAPAVKSFLAFANQRGRTIAVSVGLILTLASGTAYFFGARNNGRWLHNWDLFHTVMTAKYLDELGYFRLYECAFVFESEGKNRMGRVETLRDPRTHDLRKPSDVLANNDCNDRFSAARKKAFVDDLEYFHDAHLDWPRLLRDKGYNGTPSYTAVAGFPFHHAKISAENLFRYAQIDVFLILLALVFVASAFGLETAIVVALFFFTSFPNRYTHMGGSILRFDYVAALMASLAAMKLRRHELAGALLAWACMERVFPVLFVAAYGVKVLADIYETKRIPKDAMRFAVGFLVVLVGLFVFSLQYGGGWSMWTEWWDNIRAHTSKTAAFRVGLKHFFMWGLGEGKDGMRILEPSAEHFTTWGRYFYWPVVLVVTGLHIRLVKKVDVVTFTAVFGFALFYSLLIATRYYYSVEVALIIAPLGLFVAVDYTLFVGALFLVSTIANRFLESGTGWPHIATTYWWLYGGLTGAMVVVMLRMLNKRAVTGFAGDASMLPVTDDFGGRNDDVNDDGTHDGRTNDDDGVSDDGDDDGDNDDKSADGNRSSHSSKKKNRKLKKRR